MAKVSNKTKCQVKEPYEGVSKSGFWSMETKRLASEGSKSRLFRRTAHGSWTGINQCTSPGPHLTGSAGARAPSKLTAYIDRLGRYLDRDTSLAAADRPGAFAGMPSDFEFTLVH